MFLIRHATIEDASTLLKLAKMVHFVNLPAEPDIIRATMLRYGERCGDGPVGCSGGLQDQTATVPRETVS